MFFILGVLAAQVNREEIGYFLGFWVYPDEALELATKFIRNYAED